MNLRRLAARAAIFYAVAGPCTLAGAESALPRWPYGTDPVGRAAADLPGGEPAIAARMKSDAPLRDPYAPAMLPVVAHLTPDDIVDLCAYLGSLQPK